MKFGKRQLILASLILVLGAAVYLNWQFSGVEKDLAATEVVNDTQTEKQLGQAQFVNAEVNSTEEDDKESIATASKEDNTSDTTNSEAVKETNADVKSTEEYFAQAKLSRQQAQEEAVDMVKEILEDATASESAKAEAVSQAAKIANIIQQQANVESLIKAKGFSDCLVFIQNSECSVVVSGLEINDALAITIKDIINGQTGIAAEKIKITNV